MKVEFRDVTGTGKGFCLQHINIGLQEGYLTGLVGKNGAGKTTLFRYLTDPKVRYTGEILIDGEANVQGSCKVREKIGYVSEDVKFYMTKTALENAALYGALYDAFDMDTMKKHLKAMEVPMRKALDDLSRGEYLKFQLAFAMSHGTELFLLDEVTAGMDPIFRKDFYRFLHELLRDEHVSILMSSHIQEDVEKHMDYVARIENGCITSYEEVCI